MKTESRFPVFVPLMLHGFVLCGLLAMQACSKPLPPPRVIINDPRPAQPEEGQIASMVELLPQTPNAGVVRSMSFSEDGSLLVTVSEESIRVWDTRSGLLRAMLQGHHAKITAAAFHPNSRYLASVSDQGSSSGERETKQLIVWDVPNRTILAHVEGEGDWRSVVFHPQGTHVAASSGSYTRVWAFDGQRLTPLKGDGFKSDACTAFTADGKHLVSFGYEYTAWATFDGNAIVSAKNAERKEAGYCVINRDGTTVANWRVANGKRSEFFARWFRVTEVGDLGGDHRWTRGTETWPDAKALNREGSLLGIAEKLRIQVVDMENGKVLREHKQDNNPTALAFHPQKKWLAYVRDGEIGIWDYERDERAEVFKTRRILAVEDLDLNGSQDVFGALGAGSLLSVWEMDSLKLKASFRPTDRPFYYAYGLGLHPSQPLVAAVNSFFDYKTGTPQSGPAGSGDVAFSPDGAFLAAEGHEFARLSVVRLADRKIVFEKEFGDLADVQFSPNGAYLGAAGKNGRIWVLEADSEKKGDFDGSRELELERGWSSFTSKYLQLDFHPTKPIIATNDGSDNTRKIPESVRLWSIPTGEELAVLTWKDEIPARGVCFDDTGGRLFSGHADGTIREWGTEPARFVRQVGKERGAVNCCRYVNGKNLLITASSEGVIGLWNLSTNEVVHLVTDGAEWLAFSPDGYFSASRDGGALVSVLYKNQVYAVDQFALFRNRPDVLLSRLGLGTQELRGHYAARYQARLKRAGLQPDGEERALLSAPEVAIRDAKQEGNRVTLELTASDQKAALKSIQVYINDVPLYGAQGRSVSGQSFADTVPVDLVEGRNKVEYSAMNENGAESIRDIVYKTGHPSGPGDLYFIGFGVSRYKNKALDLRYAHRDALDLKSFFETRKLGYAKVHSHVFVDEEATVEAIRRAKGLLQGSKPQDTVILFIAGHGAYSRDAGGAYHYLTHEADLENLEQTSAPFTLIEDILQGIPPRQKLFLMDTCESGELEEGTLVASVEQGGSRGLRHRGIHVKRSAEARKEKQRHYLLQKDRYIYNDLFRRSGAIVLSSSRGGELSYEKEELQNGLFTEAILKALADPAADTGKDGVIDARDLEGYVSKQVSGWTNGLQHPTIDRDNLYVKFGFRPAGKAAR